MAKTKQPRVGSRAWEAQQHEKFVRLLARDHQKMRASLKRGLEEAAAGHVIPFEDLKKVAKRRS